MKKSCHPSIVIVIVTTARGHLSKAHASVITLCFVSTAATTHHACATYDACANDDMTYLTSRFADAHTLSSNTYYLHTTPDSSSSVAPFSSIPGAQWLETPYDSIWEWCSEVLV